VLDIEQSSLLLELEPPFDKRDIQLARRRMAKRWHPDIAPPGRQHEHERHLKAINEAADQLERLAEESRGGKVSRNAVKVSAAAARKAREEAGRRAYEAEQRAREADADRKVNDPFGARVPDHSVVHRYARCLSYPEWGVGTVSGIYFTGDGDDVQQWARVKFQIGVRTVPAGSLQFVDFSKPDPGAERVQRFMTAGQHALAEGEYALAAQRFVYARDAEPDNAAVLRLMTMAFWQAGNLPAAARAVRDWARVEGERPNVHRFAARIYEDQGALLQARESARRETELAPADATAWERVGRLSLRLMDREGARSALERARGLGPTAEGLLDLALVYHLDGNVGGEVSVCEQAVEIEPESAAAWARYAHALARTDRVVDTIVACERALELADDSEVRELLRRVREAAPRSLPSRSAAA
jgi:tetratricopeptide (TPR) repeat protein